jgi:drug/metabolite transporter (DMT)-like permease
MWLAICGGVGFGLYFAGLKFANPLGVLEPMALARVGSLLTCVLLLGLLRREDGAAEARWVGRAGLLWAVGVAVLDTGGNLLYIAATRAGRLDVAAVLAALYPASTILLAAGLLKERPGRRQIAGMAIAVVAVVLVTS